MLLDYVQKGLVHVVADLLSVITILLCLVSKVPQIKDLYGYKSARGKWQNKNDMISTVLNVSADCHILPQIRIPNFNILCIHM